MTRTDIGDAIAVAPDMHTVLLDNDRVRVLEYAGGPGDRAEMHSHPDNVVYHLEGSCRARATGPDGQAREFDVEPGMCLWSPASAHIFEFVSGEPARGLIIELR